MGKGGANIPPASYDQEQYPQKELTQKIIGCGIRVHRALGPGYLESIYENAPVHELTKAGLRRNRQQVVRAQYDGVDVGEHRLDLPIEDKVLVELKSVEELAPRHAAQIISTLKAAKVQVGLLMNFNVARLIDGTRRIVLPET